MKRRFDLSLYDEKIILSAAKEYNTFCSVKIEDDKRLVTCDFESEKISTELIANEFDNYLIELMHSNGTK